MGIQSFGDAYLIGPLQTLAVECFEFEAVRDVAGLCFESSPLDKFSSGC